MSYEIILVLGGMLIISQQTEALKISMLIIVMIRRLLSSVTQMPSARDGRRSISTVKMRRWSGLQLARVLSERLNMWRLLDLLYGNLRIIWTRAPWLQYTDEVMNVVNR